MQVLCPQRSGGILPAAAPLFAGLVAANLAAWIWAWLAFHDRPLLLGSAFLAWMFGLRHAVDADHIAAIDNVVRKLVQDGRRPLTAGLWFSLGHSTIVVLASLGVAGTARAMVHAMAGWEAFGSLIGTSVSAVFLLAIGAANLFILRGTWRSFVRARQGHVRKDPGPDSTLSGGGRSCGSAGRCSAASAQAGTCIRSAFCSGWASTQRPRSACSASQPSRRSAACHPGW